VAVILGRVTKPTAAVDEDKGSLTGALDPHRMGKCWENGDSHLFRPLVVVGTVSPFDALIQVLGSPSSQLRKWAAVTLGNIGDARAVAHLQRFYRSSPAGSDERWVAREALLKLRATPGA
jgi:hypothetical protein